MKLRLKKTKPGNLPYISLYHGKNLYNFLVDSGSTLNWLMPKTLGDFLFEGETRSLERKVNGEKHRVLNATLRVEPRTYTEADDIAYKLQIGFCSGELDNLIELNNSIDSDKIHGILGMEFLHTVSIDLKKMVLEA